MLYLKPEKFCLSPGSSGCNGEDQLAQELFVLLMETGIFMIKKDMQLRKLGIITYLTSNVDQKNLSVLKYQDIIFL